ncbi:MAG: CBS domain-containing protein [Candidatus Eiseniibacteriota bacterium]|jgi:magnesium transporter
MDLTRSLARSFLEDHPRDAAMVIETLTPTDAIEAVSGVPAARVATVLRWMAPATAAALLETMVPDRAVEMLGALPVGNAPSVLRRVEEARREELLSGLPPATGSALRRLLRYPAGTAGAVMDPRITALVDDHTAEGALAQLRRSRDTTLYNLYVIDRERRLVGVLDLDELLRASPSSTLRALARPADLRIPVEADRRQITAHAGWQRVDSLPVVDANGVFLGAVRYRTMRQLENELAATAVDDGVSTSRALGDLFAAGLGGIVDAIAQSVSPAHRPRADRREEDR